MAVHMKKTKVVCIKLIYVGMCIFELSKTLMFEFHYECIKLKYGDKARLFMTDNGSLVYEIETDYVCADTKDDVESRFDMSEYPKDHPTVR